MAEPEKRIACDLILDEDYHDAFVIRSVPDPDMPDDVDDGLVVRVGPEVISDSDGNEPDALMVGFSVSRFAENGDCSEEFAIMMAPDEARRVAAQMLAAVLACQQTAEDDPSPALTGPVGEA